MAQRGYARILLSWINGDSRTPPDLHKVLSNLVDDINDRFERIYNDVTGQSQSINQTTITAIAPGLSNTLQLSRGVLFQFSAVSDITIPGFAGGYGGRIVVIQNISTYTYTLAHESTTAEAAHRITSRTGASLTVATGTGITLLYDDVTSRWLPVCTQL